MPHNGFYRTRETRRLRAERGHTLSRQKAKEILRHGKVRGYELTEKQIGFFGARAGGRPIKRSY